MSSPGKALPADACPMGLSAPAANRERRLRVIVPVGIAAAGGAASVVDLRAGLIAGAIVLGWTRLVGL